MHSSLRLRTLTRTVTAHVTPEEEDRIKERADRTSLTKSEWCRKALLQSLETAADTKLLLAEVLAARKIFLALHLDALQGELKTKERVVQAIESADREKFAMAERRIYEFRRVATNDQK